MNDFLQTTLLSGPASFSGKFFQKFAPGEMRHAIVGTCCARDKVSLSFPRFVPTHVPNS
jgi:hypothetical protein